MYDVVLYPSDTHPYLAPVGLPCHLTPGLMPSNWILRTTQVVDVAFVHYPGRGHASVVLRDHRESLLKWAKTQQAPTWATEGAEY